MQLIGLVLDIFAACPPPKKIQRTEINLKILEDTNDFFTLWIGRLTKLICNFAFELRQNASVPFRLWFYGELSTPEIRLTTAILTLKSR